jgi:hypothetical protein
LNVEHFEPADVSKRCEFRDLSVVCRSGVFLAAFLCTLSLFMQIPTFVAFPGMSFPTADRFSGFSYRRLLDSFGRALFNCVIFFT